MPAMASMCARSSISRSTGTDAGSRRRARATAAFQRTSSTPSERAPPSAARESSPGERAERVHGRLAHAGVFAARELGQGGLGLGIADRAQRPYGVDLRLRIGVGPVRRRVLRRLEQRGHGAAVAEAAQGQGHVAAHARVVARRFAERAHRLLHEPRVLERGVLPRLQDLRQLEGGLPAAVGAARAHLVEVLARSLTFGGDEAEDHEHRHAHGHDGEREDEELQDEERRALADGRFRGCLALGRGGTLGLVGGRGGHGDRSIPRRRGLFQTPPLTSTT